MLIDWAFSLWRTCEGPGMEGRLRVCRDFWICEVSLSPFSPDHTYGTHEQTNDSFVCLFMCWFVYFSSVFIFVFSWNFISVSCVSAYLSRLNCLSIDSFVCLFVHWFFCLTTLWCILFLQTAFWREGVVYHPKRKKQQRNTKTRGP